MRFRNLSSFTIPKDLWRSLASAMELSSVLPQALSDELGMYGEYRTLRITINPERVRGSQHSQVTLGSYTFGHISLFPCPNCTVGFLTHVLLHELHHAWLHQYHEVIYESVDSCRMEDAFASEAFKILGGRIGAEGKCADFKLDVENALECIGQFQKFVEEQ